VFKANHAPKDDRMPRKPKAKPVDLPAISAEVLEQFGSGPMTAEAITAAALALKKALIWRNAS
jgi:putative transposase